MLFETPILICVMLIVGGIILLVVDKMSFRPRYTDITQYPAGLAFKIGLFQCLAMIPGTSRSGATIVGALLMGTDKRSAAEFSFFLAMPTMLGAFVLDLYKNRNALSFDDAGIIAIGFVAAFVTALFVVRSLLDFVFEPRLCALRLLANSGGSCWPHRLAGLWMKFELERHLSLQTTSRPMKRAASGSPNFFCLTANGCRTAGVYAIGGCAGALVCGNGAGGQERACKNNKCRTREKQCDGFAHGGKPFGGGCGSHGDTQYLGGPRRFTGRCDLFQ